MAVLRRNTGWLSLAGILVCALAVGGWVLSRSAPAAVAMQQSYQPLDAVSASQIEALRRENGLDDDALAAIDASAQQLEALLVAVRSWHETNAAVWFQKRSAVADQRALIRQLRSAINMGRDRTAELAAAIRQLTQLEADYESSVAGLRLAAAVGLSPNQQALAERMRLRRSISMPFRVLGLNGAQDRALRQARSRYHQRLAVTRDTQQRATIREEYEQELESALGTANLQWLNTLRGYLGPASERVVAAVQTVLAVEPQG
jgi:hypothetical protein